MKKFIQNIFIIGLLTSYILLGVAGYTVIQIAIGFGTDPFRITKASNIPNTTAKHFYAQPKHISSIVKNNIILIAVVTPQFNNTIDKIYELIPIERLSYNPKSFPAIHSTRSPPLI